MAEGNRINAPTREERGTLATVEECKFALAPSLTKLMEMATSAGWQRHHVAIAMAMFADEAFDHTERSHEAH
ncbi:hypothetical protein [Aquamicrobium defluvii]|uniref:Uncharacterized protein n=1 Tax=Aquamicrobium defluvii TaxID=69279 RepID=A0A011VN38_9HYPH|nr:hypothetical protein [Aquamicrobium defluvii]EXL09790.1 hypothetical protein BG36_17565 [Aquamicrobium defluvii]EZQ16749.1 hypothetical protein CF98_39895 [Halopseudomonas bauzanensis]